MALMKKKALSRNSALPLMEAVKQDTAPHPTHHFPIKSDHQDPETSETGLRVNFQSPAKVSPARVAINALRWYSCEEIPENGPKPSHQSNMNPPESIRETSDGAAHLACAKFGLDQGRL